jgi:hypothetical protein
MEELKSADAVIYLLTEAALTSQYIMSEIGAARAFAAASGRMLMIPVILDDMPIPPLVADIMALTAADRNVARIVADVDKAVHAFLGRRTADDQAAEEVSKRIETNAAQYVEQAIESLAANERRDRLWGLFWSGLGFGALLLGVVFGFWSLSQVSGAQDGFQWLRFSYLSLKSIIVIGLLLACSKYAFMLGKTYMNESLKSADRIHAIRFGTFYLKAYGGKTQWAELKEVFQHWNIDKASGFSVLDGGQFDPKFVEAILEVAKAVANRK